MKLARQWPWFTLLGLAVLWRAIYAYWTPLVNRYLVPPGDDPAFHLDQVDRILHGNVSFFHDGYPLGFHLVTAAAAKLFGMDSLTAIRLVPPILLVIPVVVMFIVGRRLFGSVAVGAIAAAAWSFLALAPSRAFGDGNYPNLLAGSIFLPWAMLAFYEFCRERTWKNLLLLIVPTGLIFFTHHLTLIFFLIASLPLGLATLVYRFKKAGGRLKLVGKLIAAAAALALVGAGVWHIYAPLALPYWQALLRDHSLGSILGPYSTPPSFAEFLDVHTPFFLFLGFVGAVALAITHRSRQLKLLMFGWLGMLLLLSITPVFGLPGRFLRELAVPLALLIGYFPVAFFQQIRTDAGRLLLVLLVAGLFVGDWLYSFHRPYALPDPFGPLVRVQHDEEPALTTLDIITPPGGVILANNSDPYLGYLVHRKVIVVSNPLDVGQILASQPVTTVYVGARPPLTPDNVYPYFENFDATTAALTALPGLVPAEVLGSGTRVYRYLPSAGSTP